MEFTCDETVIKIINATVNNGGGLEHKKLETRINDVLKDNPDKKFVDIRYLSKDKAMLIMGKNELKK